MKNSFRYLSPFVLILFASFLLSCGNAAEKKNLERCDQIAAKLDSAGKKLGQANEDTLKKKFMQFKEASGKLEKDFYAIKTDENFSEICMYRDCKKPLKNLTSNYLLFKKEIDTSAAQVQRLRHDIKEDLLTRDEITQYLTLEEENAKTVLKKISKSVDDALQYEKRFDSLHPRILKYIEKAKPKK